MDLSFKAHKAIREIDDNKLPDGSEHKPRSPLTREARERVPGQMAANLMDYYLETIADDTQLNPIRDGIPQCRNHPFKAGSMYDVGCIHSCAKRDPNLALPVVKDYTLGDVYEWVKALVFYSVQKQEIKMGYKRPTDLTR